MALSTKIEWTNATWNPWQGCHKVSPGCYNCYMYREKQIYGQNPEVIVRSRTTFNDPMKWKNPRFIFVCSWSDWFIEDADSWRNEAWEIIRNTPYHTYQILTKRPERIKSHLPHDWKNGWENVWLGVSIENQDYIFRKKLLLKIPAKIHFISAEPLLGPIDLGELKDIDWVITGGESGPNARSMHPDWARSIKNQCIEASVAYFHKQNGGSKKIHGAWGGRVLDGKTWDSIPEKNMNLDYLSYNNNIQCGLKNF